MKAGLFGGGWDDYLDALNDAFDRHVAENAPPHPFGAGVDAIMTGYADGATTLPWRPSRNAADTDAMVPLPFPNFTTNPDGSRVFQRGPQMMLLNLSQSANPDQFSGTVSLGQRSGLQFPQGDQGGSDTNSASFITQGVSAQPSAGAGGEAPPSVWQSKAMQDAAARAAGDRFSPPPGFREPVNDCATREGPDADACIDIDADGKVKTWYNHPSYDHLGEVARAGVDAHENIHRSQIEPYLHWWEPTDWSRWFKDQDFNSDPGKFEIPAYQAEIDSLQRYLDQRPEDPNYDALAARIKDRQQHIEGYLRHQR